MGILRITNRTENWKTAETFCGLSEEGRVSLVEKLSGGASSTDDIKLELFWYGMRDYVYEYGGVEEESVDRYVCLFPDLRKRIDSFEYTDYIDGKRTLRFNELLPRNYDASTSENKAKLYRNLQGTEIDIVLETEDHLFIGEAKDESSFNARSERVLVHQLIRQYVMAKILVDLSGKEKKVVPFIVGDPDKLSSIKNTGQVRFMKDRGWLEDRNVLSWDCIKQLR